MGDHHIPHLDIGKRKLIHGVNTKKIHKYRPNSGAVTNFGSVSQSGCTFYPGIATEFTANNFLHQPQQMVDAYVRASSTTHAHEIQTCVSRSKLLMV